MPDHTPDSGVHAADSAVDLAKALEWVDHDRELLTELVGIFLEDFPQRIAELREALAQREAPRVQRVAHGLKGSVSGFGAPRARDLALKLELIAKNGDMGEAPQALAELEAELGRVAEGLAAPGWRAP